jgi:hypothetical protein
VEDEEERYWS